MASNKKLIILGLVLVFVLITIFLVWKFDFIERLGSEIKLRQELRRFQQSLGLLNTLEKEKRPQAIPELEKIIKFPTSLDKEAYAKILLAGVFFDNNDTAFKAIGLLKEVAIEEKYPKRWRAIAINNIAQVANNYPKDFREKYIFSSQPFESFYKKEKNLSLVIRRLYEWSDQLHPLDIPNYQIAHWYADMLARDRIQPYLSLEKKEKYSLILNQRLKKADQLFAQTPLSKQDHDTLLLVYLLKARILGKLYLINPSNEAKTNTEIFFKKALKIDQEIFLPKKTGYATLFHYAAFLAEVYGNSKINEIKSLLTPLYDPSINRNQGFFSQFLTNEKTSFYIKHYHKREILLLVNLDERFKDLLKQLGWTDEQLNTKITPLGKQK